MRSARVKCFCGPIRFMALLWAAILMMGGNYASARAETAQDIEAGISACLGRFYRQINGGQEMAAMAEGVLVIPNVAKAGLIVGGEYGEGALRVGGRTVSYYNLASGSIGLQVGAEAKDIVILFMTADALKHFQASGGWEVGVDGNVAMVNFGSGKRVDFIGMNDPIIGFVFDVKGFLADISVKGAKFTRINPK